MSHEIFYIGWLYIWLLIVIVDYLLGWSLWWEFKVKTLFQATVKWDLDNITAKSYPEGTCTCRCGNEQGNDINT